MSKRTAEQQAMVDEASQMMGKGYDPVATGKYISEKYGLSRLQGNAIVGATPQMIEKRQQRKEG